MSYMQVTHMMFLQSLSKSWSSLCTTYCAQTARSEVTGEDSRYQQNFCMLASPYTKLCVQRAHFTWGRVFISRAQNHHRGRAQHLLPAAGGCLRRSSPAFLSPLRSLVEIRGSRTWRAPCRAEPNRCQTGRRAAAAPGPRRALPVGCLRVGFRRVPSALWPCRRRAARAVLSARLLPDESCVLQRLAVTRSARCALR